MKKMMSTLFCMMVLLSCAVTAHAAQTEPDFSYVLELTDGSGKAVEDIRSLEQGETVDLSIVMARNDIQEDSYDAYVVEFKVTTRGLRYNGDGRSFRTGSGVGAIRYLTGLVTGVTYIDLSLKGETIANPVEVCGWSYTVEDPKGLYLMVTTATVYPTGSDEGSQVMGKFSLTLDPTSGKLAGKDVSGEYVTGDIVNLPAAERGGYTFKGWSDGKRTWQADEKYAINDDVTLIALWEKDTDSVLNSVDHFAYIQGYADGTVRPEEKITRAEVATMLYRVLDADRRDKIFTTKNTFRDVMTAVWYNKAVSSMVNGGYITGYPNGIFGGKQNITRAEFVAMIVRLTEVESGSAAFDDVSRQHWACDHISAAASAGWIQGYEDGSFRPDASITRAEAITIMNRVLSRGVDSTSELDSYIMFRDNSNSAKWYYYEVIEATNSHTYTGARPSEDWSGSTVNYVYDIERYEKPQY